MREDCHIHMVLDGVNWKNAIARHQLKPDTDWIRMQLQVYQNLGFSYLRDGGDKWGVGAAARQLAPDYGITYRTPLAPLCKSGHYGGFIGEKFDDLLQFQQLVIHHKKAGADFIKVMISGLMDFNHYGVLSEDGLDPETIREMIHIAHDQGFSVMAHANGNQVVRTAAEAGVDSIEHGAYLHQDALDAMAQNHVVWVPTLSTIGNLRGKNRFPESEVSRILENALLNVARFSEMGGLLAPGTDAGAWAVPHGALSEYQLLNEALGYHAEASVQPGIRMIQKKF